jgi:hypothetical protein
MNPQCVPDPSIQRHNRYIIICKYNIFCIYNKQYIVHSHVIVLPKVGTAFASDMSIYISRTITIHVHVLGIFNQIGAQVICTFCHTSPRLYGVVCPLGANLDYNLWYGTPVVFMWQQQLLLQQEW